MLTIFGLGGNVEPRADYIEAAVAALEAAFGPVRRSPVYVSRALLPPGAPAEWDVPYLNLAVAAEANEPPQALLARTKALETQLGRQVRGHWGPREIDIDILAMGDTVLNTPTLTLPHAELLKRDFALLPLADIAPDWRYPAQGAYQGCAASELVGLLGYAPHAGLMRMEHAA